MQDVIAGHWRWLGGNLLIALIVSAVALRYFYVQHQWRAQLERETRARIQALQSRIRPHFLFNSMNTIASFTRSHPEVAEQVVEDLADLFRVSVSDARVPSSLARELELARQYLRIEGLRLGTRLRVSWALADFPPGARVPALTLQPLLENAVYHGVEPDPRGGRIEVSLETHEHGWSGQTIRLRIMNSIPPEGSRRAGHGVGLENVQERLEAFFGGRCRFAVATRDCPGSEKGPEVDLDTNRGPGGEPRRVVTRPAEGPTGVRAGAPGVSGASGAAGEPSVGERRQPWFEITVEFPVVDDSMVVEGGA